MTWDPDLGFWSNPGGRTFSSKFIHSMEKGCSLERGGVKKEEGKGKVHRIIESYNSLGWKGPLKVITVV